MATESTIPARIVPFPLAPHQPAYVKKNKIVSAEEAVRIIRDGDTVVFSESAGVGRQRKSHWNWSSTTLKPANRVI